MSSKFTCQQAVKDFSRFGYLYLVKHLSEKQTVQDYIIKLGRSDEQNFIKISLLSNKELVDELRK